MRLRAAPSGCGWLEAARDLPGVTAVGLTTNVPFNGNVSSGSYSIVGYTPGPAEAAPHGRQEVVGARLFRGDADSACRGPRLQRRRHGRQPAGRRRRSVPREEVLCEAERASASRFRRGGPDSPPMTIVGVVGTINSIDLGQPVTKERVYRPATQQPPASDGAGPQDRSRSADARQQVRAAVQAIDPEQPLGRRAHDGSMGGAIARTAADPGGAARAVRTRRARAVGDRDLRRARVRRRAARSASSGFVRRSARTGSQS